MSVLAGRGLSDAPIHKMHYYLFDSSAVVLKHKPDPDDGVKRAKKVMDAIEAQRKENAAFFFLPDFCVVEAFNTLAKWFWREKRFRTKEQYEAARTALERDVKRDDDELDDKRRFYAYDLHRYHVLNCNKVFEVEHTTEPLNSSGNDPKGCYLSSCDILIIAMGMELMKIHAGREVRIVTGDGRLTRIAKKLSDERPAEFAGVVNLYKSSEAELPRP